MPLVDQGIFHMTDHWIRIHPEAGGTAIKHDPSLRSQIPPLREFLRIIVTDTRPKAESAAQRLAGGEAFFEVAHELSNDASASAGGYLGETWLSQMRPELAAAARTLPYGETSGIVDIGKSLGDSATHATRFQVRGGPVLSPGVRIEASRRD
jgi:hypothetical protein